MRSIQSIGDYIYTYRHICLCLLDIPICIYIHAHICDSIKKVLDGKSNEENTIECDEVSAMLDSWSEVSLSSDISDQI